VGDMAKLGQAHPAMSSLLKYYGTELNKRRMELVMAAGGSEALEWEGERSREGRTARAWLRSKANSIEGGTSEVQLNIVAKRILGLPGAQTDSNMPLVLSDQENMLRDNGRGFLSKKAPIAHLRHLRDTHDVDGFSRPLWKD